jgi:hypothetical protein
MSERICASTSGGIDADAVPGTESGGMDVTGGTVVVVLDVSAPVAAVDDDDASSPESHAAATRVSASTTAINAV